MLNVKELVKSAVRCGSLVLVCSQSVPVFANGFELEAGLLKAKRQYDIAGTSDGQRSLSNSELMAAARYFITPNWGLGISQVNYGSTNDSDCSRNKLGGQIYSVNYVKPFDNVSLAAQLGLLNWKNTNSQCDVSGTYQQTGTDLHFQLSVRYNLNTATSIQLGVFRTNLNEMPSLANDHVSGGVLSVVYAF